MLKNYLKMAYRNLMRHKVFSLINVLGLALGMTCSILIMLWVQDEMSYDKFHKNADDLYRIVGAQHYPGADDLIVDSTPGLLAPTMKQELPEVERATRVTWPWPQLLSHGDKALKVSGRYVDPDFLHMFSFKMLQGDSTQALNQPRTVVVTDSLAQKLFGRTDVVGQTLKLNDQHSYKITGVVAKAPENSSYQFDFLMPFQDYAQENEWLNEWGGYSVRTLLQLKAGTDVAAFNSKIKDFVNKRHERRTDLFVQPITEMHLYGDFSKGIVPSGDIVYVRLFVIIAIFILVIACINFMNLATARSAKRAKEVGVRKAIGAGKSNLIWQFMLESVLIAFLALFVAANLVGILLPYFNELTGKSVVLDLTQPELLLLLLGVALFTGVVSGSYPAFFLSSFKPVEVLKGTLQLNKGVAVFRKGLVVFQFILSALLIVSTLVVYLQLEFIHNKKIGLDRENLVYVPIEGELSNRLETVIEDLKRTSGVVAVSSINQFPLSIGSNTSDVIWPGKEQGDDVLIDVMDVNHDLLETMGMEMKEGRFFSKKFGTDTAAYVVNEEAARLMQLKEPVGQTINMWEADGKIVGVMKDFQSRSMQYGGAKPLIMRLKPSETNNLYVRIAPGNTQQVLGSLEAIMQKYNPAFPFSYSFLSEDFERMYRSEAIIGSLTRYFAGIAIFISCLGLFGLALFTAEQRTKEIGVRKVLGASVASIVFMLSKDFLKLVLLANVIALPLSWYLMSNWLQGYAYRTEVSWWVFAVALLATVVIAMFTLSFHAIKTAVANPVNSLRSE